MKHFTSYLTIATLVVCSVIVYACSKEEEEEIVPTPHAHTVYDMEGYTIATLQGSTSCALFDTINLNINNKHYRTPSDVLSAVECGLADFGIVDSLMLIGYDCEKHNIKQSFVMRSKNLEGDIAVMFAKDSTDLRNSFNKYFADLKVSEVYDAILNRWLNNNVYSSKIPTPQNATSNDTLFVAVCSGSPFSFIDNNGEWQGYEIELTSRFATYLGRPVKYVNTLLDNAKGMLNSGIVDMAATQIFVTPERENDFIFSTPYYHCPSVVIERIR